MSKLALDGHKLLYHLDRLLPWFNGEEVYPIYASLGPSRLCNHRCIFCAYGYLDKNKALLEKDLAIRIIDELAEAGILSIFFSGDGEPLCNPHTAEMIERAHCSGIDVALNTNGVLMTPKVLEKIMPHLSWMRVSIDAGCEKTYAQIHGTKESDFKKVISHLSLVSRMKEESDFPVTIGTQYLLLENNWQELEELALRLTDAGVEYLAVKPFLKHPSITFQGGLTITEGKKSILAHLAEKHPIVYIRWDSFEKYCKRSYTHCLSMPFFLEITSSGDVYPCGPRLDDERFWMGNLKTHSFKALWNSETRRKVVQVLEQELDVSTCMPTCRNNACNEFLWQLKHPPQHVNFI